jgi:hypothetical protein
MTRFRLHPIVARWLRAESDGPNETAPPDWDAWLLRRMSRGDIIDVGGVLVDRAVLHQRFACVSHRCAPGPDRGHYRSCCADALVPLTRAEDRRLAGQRPALFDWMKAREPRLARCHERGFHRGSGELGLARPDGRCVFSQLDGQGRIRCRLHAFARRAHVDRGQLQPVSCRLFPLIVVDRGAGRSLLTVVAPHTRRLVSAYPAHRYPCLDDASLPPLHASMQGDLDWLFGAGFARALAHAR